MCQPVSRMTDHYASFKCHTCSSFIVHILQLAKCACGKYFHKHCVNKLELPGNALLMSCHVCHNDSKHHLTSQLDAMRDQIVMDNMSEITIRNYKTRVRTVERVMALHLGLKHSEWLSVEPVKVALLE